MNNPYGQPLEQQLAQFLMENAGGPAIAVISPEANALALGIIKTIDDAQLPIKFHNIHLVRPPSNISLFEDVGLIACHLPWLWLSHSDILWIVTK